MSEDYKNLITRKHLASLWSLDIQTIHRYEKKGMPVVYIGKLPRYHYEDVEAWREKVEGTTV